MITSNHLRMLALLLALLSPLGLAQAQVLSPLHVGAAGSISNEFGVVLAGHASQPGCAVRVLWATNGIYPPNLDGSANPSNAPVTRGQCGVGYLTSPYMTNSGLFGLLIHPRPASGRAFVRVFNHADPAQATFYADSPVMDINATTPILAAKMGSTTNAIDPADDDSDGLNNSWEKSYGSDPDEADSDHDGLNDGDEHLLGLSPTLADTDHDGVSDSHEWRAGTDGRDPASFLGLSELTPADADHLVVQWASVPGKMYQVEASTDLASPEAFTPITGLIPADSGAMTATTLTNALPNGGIWLYRIRLAE